MKTILERLQQEEIQENNNIKKSFDFIESIKEKTPDIFKGNLDFILLFNDLINNELSNTGLTDNELAYKEGLRKAKDIFESLLSNKLKVDVLKYSYKL
jgi:hypothetical protein